MESCNLEVIDYLLEPINAQTNSTGDGAWDNVVQTSYTIIVVGDVSNFTSNVTVGTNGYVGVTGNFDNTKGTVDNSAGGSIVVGGTILGNPIGGNVKGGVILE